MTLRGAMAWVPWWLWRVPCDGTLIEPDRGVTLA